MIRNVQGQTNIKDNFNFVQSMTDTHSDKATLWIIELLTSQLKTMTKNDDERVWFKGKTTFNILLRKM